MKKLLFPAIACFLFSADAFAQNPVRCSSYEYQQQQVALNPALQQAIDAEDQAADQFAAAHPNGYHARATVTIPVVFHVVYKTTAQNISNTRLSAQIDVLNKDYRRWNTDTNLIPAVWKSLAVDCEINFCMAHRDPNGNWTDGIERVSTTVTSWSTNDDVKSAAAGGADAWDRTKYLNIWVCNLSGGVLGYASFPGGPAADDGVVLSYQYVGTVGASAPYNKGRTATHEIGHWLNLRHIWGDDGTSCSGSDAVADTPNQSSENYGCPTFPHTDACSPNSPGVMFMNFMDYTDDACMYMFTAAQKTRMWNTLNGSRLSIQSSNACQAPTGMDERLGGIFSIAPSPTCGAFTLDFGNAAPQKFDVLIFNVLGAQVFNQHYEGLSEAELHLDLQGNPAGVYLVEVRTSTARTTRKIVLE